MGTCVVGGVATERDRHSAFTIYWTVWALQSIVFLYGGAGDLLSTGGVVVTLCFAREAGVGAYISDVGGKPFNGHWFMATVMCTVGEDRFPDMFPQGVLWGHTCDILAVDGTGACWPLHVEASTVDRVTTRDKYHRLGKYTQTDGAFEAVGDTVFIHDGVVRKVGGWHGPWTVGGKEVNGGKWGGD